MKVSFLVFVSILVLCSTSSVEAKEIKPGALFHITGCENGELMVPVVNIWSKPGGLMEGATVIGKLSGDGRKEQGLRCQGAVVKALETKSIGGRTYIRIKTVVGSTSGWITDSFVGRSFNRAKCKSFFSENSKYIANCLEK